MYKCPFCNNSNPLYIGYKDNIPYCRRCNFFKRSKKVDKNIIYDLNSEHAFLNYELSKTQKNASDAILSYIKKNESVIVNAVCGAGKTELVYQTIEYIINKGGKVAFAIPRKDVCLEIYERLKKDYPNVSITLVVGGQTSNIISQIIVLTTHQLFRYNKYFDLLILDEADAFPFYGNDLLKEMLKKAIKGPIIYLSATIKDSYKKECKNVILVNRRFHNFDLPVPKYIKYYSFNKINVLNETINLMPNKQILIFVPTIKIAINLAYKTNYPCVYSSFAKKNEYIDMFRNKKIRILISTSILERGVTFFDVQVIVFEADHALFDLASLVQISGRVGRKIKAPTGSVYFLALTKSEAMDKCMKEIIRKNKSS